MCSIIINGVSQGMLHQATVTLTDAQVKTLPGTSVVVIEATETLNFSGIPTRIPIPVSLALILDTRGGAYTNISGTNISLELGNADALSTIVVIEEPLAEVSVTWVLVPCPNFTVAAGVLDVPWLFLLDNYEDNALRLQVANGVAGSLTGGNVANKLTACCTYLILNTTTGEFE